MLDCGAGLRTDIDENVITTELSGTHPLLLFRKLWRDRVLNIPPVESPFFEEHFPAERTDPELWRVARSLHEEGFAIIDFPDDRFAARVEEILANLGDRFDWDDWRADRVEGLRIQDAWQFDEQVRAIAVNEAILRLLSQLYGRKAFPFQTLNFPVGTQQHYHTDCVHFASVPERFMCGVWVAFEDVGDDAGPLLYYPKSHQLPIYLNEHLGTVPHSDDYLYGTYPHFVTFWRRLVEAHGLQPVEFHPKKGQALIWAANLLHGGMPQRDKNKTRWSQVTHYFFEDCAYYTPLESLPYLGLVEYRELIDIATAAPVRQAVNGVPLTPEIIQRLRRQEVAVEAEDRPVEPESAAPRPGILSSLRERLRGGWLRCLPTSAPSRSASDSVGGESEATDRERRL